MVLSLAPSNGPDIDLTFMVPWTRGTMNFFCRVALAEISARLGLSQGATMHRTRTMLIAATASLLGAACANSGASSPSEVAQSTVVRLHPDSASLAPHAVQSFGASVTSVANLAVTWSVREGAQGGTITAEGVYTAPSAPGTFYVVARSVADGTTGQAVVTVTASPVGGGPSPTYYVDSMNGSDSAAGTTPDKAWKTLATLDGKVFKPGDVVAFRRGGTYPGKLTISQSGTEQSPILFTAYDAGALPVLDGAGSRSWPPFVVHVEPGVGYIVIDSLRIQNVLDAGVSFDSGSHHNVVRNCEITNTGAGVNASGSHHSISKNYIHDLHMVVNDTALDNDYGAVGVNLSDAAYNEVSYNRMVRCRAPSIDYGYDGGAVEFFGTVTNSTVHHNWVESTEGFIEAGGSSADSNQGNSVFYNVVVDAYSNPLAVLHNTGPYGVAFSDLRFENNTVVSTSGNVAPAVWFSGNPSAGAASFRNNLIVLNPGQPVAYSGRDGFAHDHNLVWRTDASVGGFGMALDGTDVNADPRLVNLGANDLHLRSNSPAIQAGASRGHSLDFDGQLLPAGAPDIGAYQYLPSP
jgi:hypothetical protein